MAAYLLRLTGAMPAFAVALHGVMTWLGFVHRIHLSQEADKELEPIQEKLEALVDPQHRRQLAVVRALAAKAAEVMAKETASWHSQVRRQKDDIV